MDIRQIEYFLNLAETLNFTEAARRSGVAQPSLTRAIQKLEDELGGPLVYRDGKDSRLTTLGRDVRSEFMRIASALENVREHSENSIKGRRRLLKFAVASTIAPGPFVRFFEIVQEQLPSIEIEILSLVAEEGITELLSGDYHALILPRPPKDHPKIAIRKLFNERYMLAMSRDHKLTAESEIAPAALAAWPYIDRLNCEFHTEIVMHLMQHDVLMRPRFQSEREDWVQYMVRQGQAICIMPEYSAETAGLVLRPVSGMELSRNVSLVTVFGSGTPVELRHVAKLAETHNWCSPPDA